MNVHRVSAPDSPDGDEGLLGMVLYSVAGTGDEDPPDGVRFLTDPDEPQQVAVIRHPSGHVVPAHTHPPNPRTVSRTAEVLVFLSGSATVSFYTSRGEFVTCRTVRAGDTVVLLRGGHGLVVLEPCEILEVKQGPYHGRAADKVDLVPPARTDAKGVDDGPRT